MLGWRRAGAAGEPTWPRTACGGWCNRVGAAVEGASTAEGHVELYVRRTCHGLFLWDCACLNEHIDAAWRPLRAKLKNLFELFEHGILSVLGRHGMPPFD